MHVGIVFGPARFGDGSMLDQMLVIWMAFRECLDRHPAQEIAIVLEPDFERVPMLITFVFGRKTLNLLRHGQQHGLSGLDAFACKAETVDFTLHHHGPQFRVGNVGTAYP